ncbi:MAG TPA: DUF2807 domain-containing protein [Telluria sp.]|nr:DUF2807 domain-containing protein [Telluria sp.]
MRALLKLGFGLLVLAFALIGVSYAMLRTHGTSTPNAGEGRKIASETRQVGKNISAVELSGPIDLTLRYGTTPSLEIKGEQRLLGNIEATQDGNTLHIATRGIVLAHHHPLQAVLVLPALTNVNVDGSGDSTVDGFAGEHIDVQLDGSGSVKFNGRYRQVNAVLHGSGDMDLDVGNSQRVAAEVVGSGHMTLAGNSVELVSEATGSGSMNAQHLRADKVSVRQLGSGSSTVNAQKSVTVSLSGSGDVEVHGSPSQRSISRTGSGDITFPG